LCALFLSRLTGLLSLVSSLRVSGEQLLAYLYVHVTDDIIDILMCQNLSLSLWTLSTYKDKPTTLCARIPHIIGQ
jgi:hypothetical protein